MFDKYIAEYLAQLEYIERVRSYIEIMDNGTFSPEEQTRVLRHMLDSDERIFKKAVKRMEELNF